MAPILLTRMRGHRVVLGRVRLTDGPTAWVGEFRTNADRPYAMRATADDPAIHEVRMGLTLEPLLRALWDRSATARDLPGDVLRSERRRRRKEARSVGV